MNMPERLVELRKRAEGAVQDMPEGELKIKAFEIAFTHLLTTDNSGGPSPPQPQARATSLRKSGGAGTYRRPSRNG